MWAQEGMWVAVFGAKGFNEMAMTSELSIRFLRPASGRTLWSRVDVNSEGSRALVMTATMWTEDKAKPSSVAQGTYVMPK